MIETKIMKINKNGLKINLIKNNCKEINNNSK